MGGEAGISPLRVWRARPKLPPLLRAPSPAPVQTAPPSWGGWGGCAGRRSPPLNLPPGWGERPEGLPPGCGGRGRKVSPGEVGGEAEIPSLLRTYSPSGPNSPPILGGLGGLRGPPEPPSQSPPRMGGEAGRSPSRMWGERPESLRSGCGGRGRNPPPTPRPLARPPPKAPPSWGGWGGAQAAEPPLNLPLPSAPYPPSHNTAPGSATKSYEPGITRPPSTP